MATAPARLGTSDGLTYEAYGAMPESNRPVEVIDGVLIRMPMPTFTHQVVVKRLTAALDASSPPGLVVPSPADLVIRRRPKLRIRQPDVMYFSDARAGFACAADPNRLQSESIAPEIAVEVLSPGQNERTLAEKLRDYASIGIPEVWFVDQSTRSVRALGIGGEGYRLVGEHKPGDRLTSAALPGLDLEVAAIFG